MLIDDRAGRNAGIAVLNVTVTVARTSAPGTQAPPPDGHTTERVAPPDNPAPARIASIAATAGAGLNTFPDDVAV
jgi:hypothetical protein